MVSGLSYVTNCGSNAGLQVAKKGITIGFKKTAKPIEFYKVRWEVTITESLAMFRDLRRWLKLLLIIIFAGGVMLTAWSLYEEDGRLRHDLFVKAKIAANGIPPAQVQALQGSDADLTSPEYLALKRLMEGITASDEKVRFAYIMGQRDDGTIFFFVDSEPPESEDYSPPGQEYGEATEVVINSFAFQKELTGGPDSDRWGTWVSAMIPLLDPDTGKLIGVYGMDLDARYWYLSLFLAAAPVLLGTLLFLFLVMTFLYISEQKQRETDILDESRRAIQASEERYRLIFNSSPLGIVQIDREGIILAVNRKFADFMGVSVEKLIGFSTLSELMNPGLRAAVQEMLRGKQGYFEGEYTSVLSEKHSILRMLGEPLLNDEGKVYGAISIFEDITERKKTEEALFKANIKLNLLNSITRHDILNQLLALKGFLELSHDHRSNPEKLDNCLSRAVQAANTIERQIGFTKDYQDMGVKAAIWQDLEENLIKAKGGLPVERITIDIKDTNYEIFADPLFEKVFYNLIDNTLKHGGDHVTAIRISARETGEGLEILYQDDGAGIPDSKKKTLFDPVHAGQKGFGMVLTAQILAITGITIIETGIFGKGVQFEIRIPRGGYLRKKSPG